MGNNIKVLQFSQSTPLSKKRKRKLRKVGGGEKHNESRSSNFNEKRHLKRLKIDQLITSAWSHHPRCEKGTTHPWMMSTGHAGGAAPTFTKSKAVGLRLFYPNHPFPLLMKCVLRTTPMDRNNSWRELRSNCSLPKESCPWTKEELRLVYKTL